MANRHKKPRPPQHRRRRPRQRNKRSAQPEREKFLREYEHLIKNHDDSRKRYFDQYHRSDQNRRRKLELSFFKAVEKLREYEGQMTPEQWEVVHNKKWIDYGEDTAYSHNYQLTGPELASETWDDSMLAPSQLQRPSFLQDREASTGTMEDYHKYRQEQSNKNQAS